MLGASLLRIVRRQGRWRIVVRHPLVLQHAERPLNRWSAHSGTQKGGWNREPIVLRMVPGRVSFWRPRPPKKRSIFRPRLSASPVKKTSRGRKMTPFWGPENGPVFGTEKPEKWVHEVTKNNHHEVQFCGTNRHNDIEAAGWVPGQSDTTNVTL